MLDSKNYFTEEELKIDFYTGDGSDIPTYDKFRKIIDKDTYKSLYKGQTTKRLPISDDHISPQFFYNNLGYMELDIITNYFKQELFSYFSLEVKDSNPTLFQKLSDYIIINRGFIRYKNLFINYCTSYNKGERVEIQIFYVNNSPILNDLYDFIEEFNLKVPSKRKSTGTCFFITQTQSGYNLIAGSNYFKSNKKLNFDYYNEDFQPQYKKLITSLNDTKQRGLYFLHGIAGSGKTTLIRHLTTVIKRNMVFLPSTMAHVLADPLFLSFIASNCVNCVLILEDSEKMLTDRMVNNTNSVPNLLNISDGLLGDLLNISIICTYNTGKNNIDEALKRKGRTNFEYEFKELSIDRAQKINPNISTPMSLAECILFEEESFAKTKEKIGFNRMKNPS
jgi:energy-coupling factor transporter ATP-binding protein EcfA2